MSQDKKLRLVPPPGAPAPRAPSDEDPPTEAELAEAEALRDLLEEGREPISNSLRAAHAPPALSEPDHDALLARALGDILAPATRAEQAEAEHLAGELAGKVQGEGSEHLQLARALRSANAPRPIDQITHERILKNALGAEAKSSARGSRIAMVSALFVAAAALAMFFTTASRDAAAPASEAVARAPAPAATAAAAAPKVDQPADRAEKVAAAPAARGRAAAGEHAKRVAAPSPRPFAEPPAGAPAAAPAAADEDRPAAAHDDDFTAVAAYVPSRSTDDLFDPSAQFPKTGGESARIDRIAMARASDLRQNRFAAWGVR